MSSDELMQLQSQFEQSERSKYREIWQRGAYKSKSVHWLQNILKFYGDITYGILDIGCGDGSFVTWLLNNGQDAYGCDITLQGVNSCQIGRYYECPAWDMPYKDASFDITVSMDVLEHIPTELIPATIKEIDRVTRHNSIHIIATFPDHTYNGHEVHLTVKPIEWWAEQFKVMQCHVTLIERTTKDWKIWR